MSRVDPVLHPPPRSRRVAQSIAACFEVGAGISGSSLKDYEGEIERSGLEKDIRSILAERAQAGLTLPTGYGHAWREILLGLYAIVRHIRPRIVVETGVGELGLSTAFILKGLEQNGLGHLYSIDPDRFFSVYGFHVGQAIPTGLMRRHSLIVGTSRAVLPAVIHDVENVDFFFHDGGHTYSNMLDEFRVVWPALNCTGVLAADDVTHSALDDLMRDVSGDAVFTNYDRSTFAVARKAFKRNP